MCTHQLDIVSLWLRCGRKIKSPPVISQLKTYAVAWWAWWKVLQPEWRRDAVRGGVYEKPPPGEKWTRTYIGGSNGMFIVVLTLAWWIAKLDGKVDNKDLALAVDEVAWVLDQMMAVDTVTTGPEGRGSLSAKNPKRAATTDSDLSEVPAKKR